MDVQECFLLLSRSFVYSMVLFFDVLVSLSVVCLTFCVLYSTPITVALFYSAHFQAAGSITYMDMESFSLSAINEIRLFAILHAWCIFGLKSNLTVKILPAKSLNTLERKK